MINKLKKNKCINRNIRTQMGKKNFLMNSIHNRLQPYLFIWVFLSIFKLHIWFYYAPPKFKLKEITLSTGCNKKVSPRIVSSIHLQTATFWKWLCALIAWKIFSLVWFFYTSPNCHLPKISLNTDLVKIYFSPVLVLLFTFKVPPFKKTLSIDHMKKLSH